MVTDKLTLKSRSPPAKARRTERSVIDCRRSQTGAQQGSRTALLIDSLNGQISVQTRREWAKAAVGYDRKTDTLQPCRPPRSQMIKMIGSGIPSSHNSNPRPTFHLSSTSRRCRGIPAHLTSLLATPSEFPNGPCLRAADAVAKFADTPMRLIERRIARASSLSRASSGTTVRRP